MNNHLKSRIYEILAAEKREKAIAPRTPRTPSKEEEEKQDQLDYTFDTSRYVSTLRTMNTAFTDFEAQNTRILGIPHQFLETADMRIDSANNFGYCFAKDIYMEKPIVTFMPGKVNYLPDYSKADKKAFGSLMGDMDNANSKKALEELMSDHGETRYYDFASDYHSYILYVNLMCRVAAVYLGIENSIGPDGKTKYKAYDWADYQAYNNYQSPVKDDGGILKVIENIGDTIKQKVSQLSDDLLVGSRNYVNFFIDPSSSINENLSNSTQKSSLEGAFDSVEGIVKEASMFLNSMSGAGDEIGQFVTNAGEAVLSLANGVTLGLFKNMLGLAEKEVLHGANLIYPEIWMDSDYSKSYTIQMNLVSPYGNKEAIYLNVLVPIIHALCLALPRQSSANSFSSPFILRGHSQGWFSIDMGMVESITIDKGPEQSWSVEGLPTQAKVTLVIKDLYSQLMMSPSNKPSLFFSNQGLMDYLGVMCGVNLTTPNIVFKIMSVKALLASINDIPNNFYRKMTENFRNWVSPIIN